MFAQANSEHCRHKIFNARFTIDGEPQPLSMFQMIRNTEALAPQHTIVAYSDNAAVMEGHEVERWLPEGYTNAPRYSARRELVHALMKVETHNHPTAISPFPGASTGAGGEIRDEGATGRGSRPKAGLTGFSVSNLHLPGADGAVGEGALRQARAHRQRAADHDRRAARRRRLQQRVRPAEPGRLLPRLRADGRRPAPRLSQADHDRRRPRRDRRDADAQDRVPGRHAARPARRPGHAHRHGRRRGQLDGGRRQRRRARLRFGAARQPRDPAARAGGHQPLRGARRVEPDPGDPRRRRRRHLERVPRARRRRRPRRAASTCARCRSRRAASRPRRSGATRARSATSWRWRKESLPLFDAMCVRERCPYAVVGVATDDRELVLVDGAEATTRAVIDMPMDVLFGKPPKMHRDVRRRPRRAAGARPRRRRPRRRSRSTCCAIRPSPASAS